MIRNNRNPEEASAHTTVFRNSHLFYEVVRIAVPTSRNMSILVYNILHHLYVRTITELPCVWLKRSFIKSMKKYKFYAAVWQEAFALSEMTRTNLEHTACMEQTHTQSLASHRDEFDMELIARWISADHPSFPVMTLPDRWFLRRHPRSVCASTSRLSCRAPWGIHSPAVLPSLLLIPATTLVFKHSCQE